VADTDDSCARHMHAPFAVNTSLPFAATLPTGWQTLR
jgi:hypothetical protein